MTFFSYKQIMSVCVFLMLFCQTSLACDDQRLVKESGVIKDKFTGLIWSNCMVSASGSCAGGNGLMDWNTAIKSADRLARNGWRVPNIIELSSLLRADCDSSLRGTMVSNSLNNQYNQSGGISTVSFWSATPSARSDSLAWAINGSAQKSELTNKNTLAHGVILVRDWRTGDN